METNGLSDEELVGLFQKTHDAALFAEVFSRFKQMIYLLSLRFLRNTALAEEATQDAFIKVYESIHLYKEGNFRGWLIRTASNVCIDRLRSMELQSKKVDLEALEDAGESFTFSGRRYHAEEMKVLCVQLKRIIRGLKPEHRICLLLKYVDGYNYEEISMLTGYTLKEVKTYLQNARRNVMLDWQKTGELPDHEGR